MITLRMARQKNMMTQSEAAKKFGVHYQTLAKWETDNSKMPYNMVALIPKIYGISPDEIFFGNENDYIRFKP